MWKKDRIMVMDVKKYTGFSAKDLLDDDDFIRTHKGGRTPQSDAFWQEVLATGTVDGSEYELACRVLESLAVKKTRMDAQAKERIWERIQHTNRRDRRLRRLHWGAWGAAAAASALLVLWLNLGGGHRQEAGFDEALVQLSQADVPMPAGDIRLVLPGDSVVIGEAKAEIRHEPGGQVTVNSEQVQASDAEKLCYNQLLVPDGKRSVLILEDGTKMWVNAGTRVVYPNRFRENRREIFVDGEAYLEVARDEKRPFLLKTSMMDVQVLGTAFNVTAYREDAYGTVVLASGSVEVSTGGKEVRLVPSEMLWCDGQGGAQVKAVDVADYISWKDGLYIYHSEPLSAILDRISRYYGVAIGYDADVAAFRCSGKLNLLDNVDELLEGLAHTVPVVFSRSSDGKYRFEKKRQAGSLE